MTIKRKTFTIEWDSETKVYLNGEEVSLGEWFREYVKPMLKSFGVKKVEDE